MSADLSLQEQIDQLAAITKELHQVTSDLSRVLSVTDQFSGMSPPPSIVRDLPRRQAAFARRAARGRGQQ